MIEFKNVSLAYHKEYFTLFEINLVVNKGENLVIIGPKDSGKSSLLRLIAGLEKPTSGEINLVGKRATDINYKRDISLGYLSNFTAFFENKTVRKNLEYVLKIRETNKNEIKSRVSAVMQFAGILSLADIKLKKLSNVNKLKVAIARLKLRKLDLLLVDDIYCDLLDSDTKVLSEMVSELLKNNYNCTSVIAISNENLKNTFKGKTLHLNYGALTDEQKNDE